MYIKFNSALLTNLEKFIRRCSYTQIKDRRDKISYIRRLGPFHYPRFHIHILKNSFNLHLDQKAPSYPGAPVHNAEYESEAVKKEAERIKQFLTNLI